MGVFPLQPLVKNIGADSAATHTVRATPLFRASNFDLDNVITTWPSDLSIDAHALERFKAYLYRGSRPQTMSGRAALRVRKALQNVPGLVRRVLPRSV